MDKNIDMIVFDLFGTLIKFGTRRHPYRTIMNWAREHGRRPQPNDARTIMTTNGPPELVFQRLGINPPNRLLRQFESDIAYELNSLALFDDVVPTLTGLSKAGLQLAVCSNLAKPYGESADKLLREFDVLRCFSFEVGSIKPEPYIYNWLLESTGLTKQSILFIGDNTVTDYEGPLSFGFLAYLLKRDSTPEADRLSSLIELKTKVSLDPTKSDCD
ncbi:MAG: HAD hydrolase-like protein [Pseudomonadota bacterium]|nr:HAD hydrolase-like protein [Pseudomonadota bacterium]